MAAHRRTELRQQIVQRLKAANTRAALQVFSGRLHPAMEHELAAGGVIFVYTGDEETPPESYPLSNYKGGVMRALTLDIEVITLAFRDDSPNTADFTYDAFLTIDELTAQVEDALETFDVPGAESGLLRLHTTKPEVGQIEGSIPVARAQMRYKLTYMTPYRMCSDPLVDNDSDNLLLRGLYPGGQVIEGCPADFTGEACPIPNAIVIPEGDLMEPGAIPVGNQA
jgi:hypothetical protein